MPKAVATREAQNALSSLIGWVQEHHDEVIIENRGKPVAVLIAFEAYEQLQALKEQRRRRAVWEQLRALQARVASRNADLSEEEAEVLADEVSREAIESLVEQGRVRFER